MKMIIQIPCFNEEKTLPETYADIPRKIEGVDVVEVLIIDDGSSDRTAEVARGLGVEHIVSYVGNKGLAYAFMAGINASLSLGADIIVNTDADNQYNAADIPKLIRPIIDKKADIVVGERPIDETEHFSKRKKRLQHIGSAVVRLASNTSIPDAPSGFRAYSREAAMRINVINEYTYTLETIIQAGRNRLMIASVPIRTNPETRKSRLFKSMRVYISRSVGVIFRSFMMYRPLAFFGSLGAILLLIGVLIGVRFLVYYIGGDGAGHIQSLILASSLSIVGVLTMVIGLLADIISANRKLLEDVQYRLRKMEYESRDRHAS